MPDPNINKKISELPDAMSLSDADELVLARSNVNYKVTGAQIKAAAYVADNIIINGNMDIWQRRVSTQTETGATSVYVADRFKYVQDADSAVDISSTSAVPPLSLTGNLSNSSLQTSITTADATIDATQYAYHSYVVEGPDAGVIIGKTINLSFAVYSTVTGTFSVALRNSDSLTGGANPRTYVSTYTVSAPNTWQVVSIPVEIPSTESSGWKFTEGTRGLGVQFILAAGANHTTTDVDQWNSDAKFASSSQANVLATVGNVFRIAQVKLEIGSQRTLLNPRPIAQELKLCQRYFQTSYYPEAVGTALAGRGAILAHSITGAVDTIARPHIQFFSQMMPYPTLQIYSYGTGASGYAYGGTSGNDIAVSSLTGSGTGGHAYITIAKSAPDNSFNFHWSADADF